MTSTNTLYKRGLLLLALGAACAGAQAATAPVSPAKQALVDQVLKLWNPDYIGQSMLQVPVGDAVQQARAMLQGRAAPEKRDAAMNDIVGEAKQFMAEATPITKGSADKLIPTTIAPLLAERYTEDELKQLIAILESPVKKNSRPCCRKCKRPWVKAWPPTPARSSIPNCKA